MCDGQGSLTANTYILAYEKYIYSYICSVFTEGKSVILHLRMRQHLEKGGSLAQGEIQGSGIKAISPEHDSDKFNWITAVTLHFLEGCIKSV